MGYQQFLMKHSEEYDVSWVDRKYNKRRS